MATHKNFDPTGFGLGFFSTLGEKEQGLYSPIPVHPPPCTYYKYSYLVTRDYISDCGGVVQLNPIHSFRISVPWQQCPKSPISSFIFGIRLDAV